MVGMEEHMRFMGYWFFKVFLVHLQHILVLMGETDIGIFVKIIQILSSFKRQLLAVVDRLSAAAHAAAGTSHNFYEIIMNFSGLDFVKKRPCITAAVLTVISSILNSAS